MTAKVGEHAVSRKCLDLVVVGVAVGADDLVGRHHRIALVDLKRAGDVVAVVDVVGAVGVAWNVVDVVVGVVVVDEVDAVAVAVVDAVAVAAVHMLGVCVGEHVAVLLGVELAVDVVVVVVEVNVLVVVVE